MSFPLACEAAGRARSSSSARRWACGHVPLSLPFRAFKLHPLLRCCPALCHLGCISSRLRRCPTCSLGSTCSPCFAERGGHHYCGGQCPCSLRIHCHRIPFLRDEARGKGQRLRRHGQGESLGSVGRGSRGSRCVLAPPAARWRAGGRAWRPWAWRQVGQAVRPIYEHIMCGGNKPGCEQGDGMSAQEQSSMWGRSHLHRG